MTIIRYNELKKYLSTSAKEHFPSVSLLYGEEVLYKTALDDMLNAIIPVSKRSTNYESVEGTVENIYEAIEKCNTFSLIPGHKAIILSDAKFFYSKIDLDKILEKSKHAHDEDDYKAASKYFVTILNLLQLSFEDITSEGKNKKLNMDQNSDWIRNVVQYCIENNLTISAEDGNTKSLEVAIEKGFHKDNHLIITTDIADKNHNLFKIISDNGIIVDCSIPKSDKAADKKVQESVTNEKARVILQKNKKNMGKNAYSALYEMTGFDLRTFIGNLEKLISYVGDREEITENDVKALLDRTKKDPIYEFTNAIMEKNTENALFYLGSLLSGGIIEHPLQILSAIINQMRRLLIIKDFTQSKYGKIWYKECGYDQFRTDVMPAIVEYDNHMLKQIQDCQPMPSKPSHSDNKPSSGGKKKKKTSKKDLGIQDLIVAKNPNNPYPIYKMIKHSENFTKQHLISAYERLGDTDARLKSSPPAGHKLILEETILAICQRSGTQDDL
ncbi:MAG: hypothetical protein JRG81_00620 [Deltaproteobacteria bacterium]|nr:hypothetical protein [Deltaproteobacteria bacterium]